ncbi:sulfotransferase domain-containing protein [Alloalcanivorax xenomutans]|uniref:sulfotransferase domain-containing protein n=1 Tax=Alloalcanivorax xenomutans TaxID=1094342 RepID=UPI00292F6C12|nr:sulfotransferase domain-containing protein [Alloalcanivorax xenomutans]WOA33077.1 sulfotransferase domain-containing protein [Alloalcanivorax xenomutans]
MKKVDFFIIGAPKCGTTALVDTIKVHPDIFIPDVKEPHFFCFDWPEFQRYSNIGSYSSIFKEGRINGDASVWYLYSDAAPLEIYKYNPKAKIIVCLREPEKMIASLHNQLVFSAREVEPVFEKAWNRTAEQIEQIDKKRCLVHKHLDYKNIGSFHQYLKRWEDVFGKESIKIVFMDELIKNPSGILEDIFSFLSVERVELELKKSNPARQHRFFWLSTFIMRPPFPFNHIKKAIRRLLRDEGRSYLRPLYSFLSVRKKDYSSEISDLLKAEMKSYFSENWNAINKEYRK